jgi:hypothetical protein
MWFSTSHISIDLEVAFHPVKIHLPQRILLLFPKKKLYPRWVKFEPVWPMRSSSEKCIIPPSFENLWDFDSDYDLENL